MAHRILYFFGLGLAVVSLFAAAFLIIERVKLISTVREGFYDSLTYTVSQTDFELVRLIDMLTRAAKGDERADLDAVELRFEIALSRLFSLTDGRVGADIMKVDNVRATVLSAIDTLESLEPQILRFPDLAPSAQEALIEDLRALSVAVHRATVAMAALGDSRQSGFYEKLLRISMIEIWTLAVILLAGTVTVSQALVERKRVLGRSDRLAQDVAVRTEELAEANDQLRQEVAVRRVAEDEAQRQRGQLEQAARLVALGYYIRDKETGRFDTCSDQYAALFGRSPEDLVSDPRGREAVLDQVDPADRSALLQAYGQLRDGEQIEVEYRACAHGTQRYVREIVQPLADAAGAVTREIGTTLDLTEKQITERKLFASQKLESIGQLTGGIAHDFNNLLAVILGNLEAMKDETDPAERAEMIEAALAATDRGATLTKSLLSFARQARLDPQRVDLNRVVTHAQQWIRRTIPANITLRTDLAADLYPVHIDVISAESALLNLVINARDAMPRGGTLTISTRTLTATADGAAALGAGLEPGRYVELSVQDTGAGIASGDIERVFEPFYTTKAPGAGTGLGLSMVQGFVRQSGGAVTVSSEPDHGARFQLYFRADESSVVPGGEAEPAAGGGEALSGRILLAEDEAEVRALLQRTLQRGGHIVHAAESGDAARDLFDAAGPFDLLITDVVMPGRVQGPALVRALRGIQPDLPAIFLSGYPRDALGNGNGIDPGDTRLMKPVRRADLLAAVEALLRRGRAPR